MLEQLLWVLLLIAGVLATAFAGMRRDHWLCGLAAVFGFFALPIAAGALLHRPVLILGLMIIYVLAGARYGLGMPPGGWRR